MASSLHEKIRDGHLADALDELESSSKAAATALAKHVEPEHGRLLLHEATLYTAMSVEDVVVKKLLIRLLIKLYPRSLCAKDQQGNLPIHYAVINSCLDVTKGLVNKDPKTLTVKNSRGELPIHCACYRKCYASMAYLLEAYPRGLKETDNEGSLPIHLACLFGGRWGGPPGLPKLSDEAYTALVQAYPGGLQHQDNNGNLPLHLAAYQANNFYPSTISMFINMYAEGLNKKNKEGSLPIHMTLAMFKKGRLPIVKEMISKNPGCAKIPDNNGDLPIHIAVKEGATSVMEALIDIYPEGLLLLNKMGLAPISKCRGDDDFEMLAKRSPQSLFVESTPLLPVLHYLQNYNLAPHRADRLKRVFQVCLDGFEQLEDHTKLLQDMDQLKATSNEEKEQLRSTFEKEKEQLLKAHENEKEELRKTSEKEKDGSATLSDYNKLMDEMEHLQKDFEKEKEKLQSTFEKEKKHLVLQCLEQKQRHDKEKKQLDKAYKKALEDLKKLHATENKKAIEDLKKLHASEKKKAMEDLKKRHATEKRWLINDKDEAKRKVVALSARALRATEADELLGTIEELEKQLDIYKNDEKEIRKLQKLFVSSLDDQNNNLPMADLKTFAQSMKDRLDRTKAAKTPNAKKSGIQITFRLFIRSPDLSREDLIECIQTLETELTALEEETDQVVPDVATSDDRNGNHSSTSNSWTGRHKRRRVSEG